MEQTHASAAFCLIAAPAHRQALKRKLYAYASVPALVLGFEGLEPWEAYPRFDLAAFTGRTSPEDVERDVQATIRELRKVLAELKASLSMRSRGK